MALNRPNAAPVSLPIRGKALDVRAQSVSYRMMTRDEFRALCAEILTPKKPEASHGRHRPAPKFAFSPTTYMEGWIFHLWRPFLAVRISKNPRNGLMRFEPAFYSELMKLRANVLERTLFHTVKHGFDNMEQEPGASRRMTVEIVVMPTNVDPPVTTNAYSGPKPLIVYVGVRSASSAR